MTPENPPIASHEDPLSMPRPPAAFLRNLATILLLVGLPLIGIIAIWTIAPWSKKAKIITTAIVFIPAVYYPTLLLYSFAKAAYAH